MYCGAVRGSVLGETELSKDELFPCVVMECGEASQCMEKRDKGQRGRKGRKETEDSSNQPRVHRLETHPLKAGEKEKMGFLPQKLEDDVRRHADRFNQRPDLGHQEPREEAHCRPTKAPAAALVGAGLTNQSFHPWAQDREKLGKRKDLKKIACDLNQYRKN